MEDRFLCSWTSSEKAWRVIERGNEDDEWVLLTPYRGLAAAAATLMNLTPADNADEAVARLIFLMGVGVGAAVRDKP